MTLGSPHARYHFGKESPVMAGIHDLGLFVFAGVLLNLTPGVDFLYVLGRSASRGLTAGVRAALGIGAGCFVHITAAALGLSAILASSAAAFTIVKWIGAAYLLYVGIGMIRQRASARVSVVPAAPCAGGDSRRIFWQGFATNVLNPKVALFFLAFVPQFIDVHSSGKVQAFLVLGTIFNTTGTLWNLFVAWSSASIARRLDLASRVGRWLNRALGAMFIALGVKLALTERP
jgi:threonine/homoserine/homoserine lactone efflux protein